MSRDPRRERVHDLHRRRPRRGLHRPHVRHNRAPYDPGLVRTSSSTHQQTRRSASCRPLEAEKCPKSNGSSEFSSAFLDAAGAVISVVSSGDNENYGHPQPDLMGALGRHARAGRRQTSRVLNRAGTGARWRGRPLRHDQHPLGRHLAPRCAVLRPEPGRRPVEPLRGPVTHGSEQTTPRGEGYSDETASDDSCQAESSVTSMVTSLSVARDGVRNADIDPYRLSGWERDIRHRG